MLSVSRLLYSELNNDLQSISDTRRDNMKAIFSEYVIIKCAEEIKNILKDLIYEYLSKNKDLAYNILNCDRHIMPRDFKRLDESFKNASFDTSGLSEIKLITASRHGSAHTSTTSMLLSWEQLSTMIEDASVFLKNFSDFISSE